MIPLEIERKFLIKENSVIDEKCSDSISIEQVYLKRTDTDIQRRVRLTKNSSGEKYFYTEKRFIKPSVREENEREISREEYLHLKTEADASLAPVNKLRRILTYNGQRFEIDSYSFSDELATMELELSDENQPIDFPPFITVIKEVTGDNKYSNASLAIAGRFPE